MPFQYSCFISYCHGQHELVKAFLDQLKAGLKNELDALLDEQVYIDEERLKPGYQYDEELAHAICQSVCMVVVYSPRYERHEYCVREYEGMARLEEKRRLLLGAAARGRGFIIPVILRGSDSVPEWIRNHKHCCDFSRFTLATPDISRNLEYAEQIKRIASVIHEAYLAFAATKTDPCETCVTFALPPASEVAVWRPAFVNR